MKVSIVMVEPEYDGNIGFVARCMANFSCKDLWLVNTRLNHLSDEALSRSMHGRKILEKAKLSSNLENTLENFDVSIATTARQKKHSSIFRELISIEELSKNYRNFSGNIAFIFGPEKNGLNNSQIKLCDAVVTIPSSPAYSTLNLSHAVTIILYEFFRGKFIKKITPPKKTQRQQLIKLYTQLIYAGNKIRDKPNTLFAFKSFLSRTVISDKEANAMMGVFSSVLKRLKAKK